MKEINNPNDLLKTIPKTEKGIDTLERICVEAERLFAEKNYYDASINEIVYLAGISTGTFYIYFNDKLSLYEYTLLRCGRRIRGFISNRLKELKPTNRREIEKQGIRAFLDFCIMDINTFTLIWQSFYVSPRMFVNYYDDFGLHYEAGLQRAVDNNEVRDVDLEILSYILMATSTFIVNKYITFTPKDEITEEKIEYITESIIDILGQGTFI